MLFMLDWFFIMCLFLAVQGVIDLKYLRDELQDLMDSLEQVPWHYHGIPYDS